MAGSYAYNPDIWPALVTLALVLYLGQYSWRRRYIPGARPFIVACALGGLWIPGVILEILALDPSTQVFWLKYQAVWPLPTATAITCFILQFAGLGRWLSLRTCALLFLFPVMNALAIATNDLHHLVWTGFEVGEHIVASPGRLFWLFNSYVYLLGLVNLVVLAWLAIRSPRHRWPVVVILCGQLLGRIAYTLHGIGVDWLGPGEAILSTVGVVSLTYAIAFLGFHFIDPVTAARASVLQQMREGMLVLDLQGRILDVNPAAAAMLGIPEAELRNRPASEVLPLEVGGSGEDDDGAFAHADIVLGDADSSRHYEPSVTPLRGRDGDLIGRLLLLHEVTGQRRAQARILEQQGVVATLRERERLARELHDGVGQTLGYVGLQAQTALKWMRSGKKERAESTLERLAEVAQEAHSDVRESILSLRVDPLQERAFVPDLRRYLERFQAHYGIRTELSISGGAGDEAFEPVVGVQLLRVVQEALSNSRRHGGARRVVVAVDMDGRRACITLSDDGRGFDTGRPGAEDGHHFGLVFMRERMEQIGGSVDIDSRPGEGTVLRLDVPIRGPGGSVVEGASG